MKKPGNKIVIAIDGYSSCGKSTFAKMIAGELGYIYIDSGAMYRAVALYCLRNGIIHEDKVEIAELKNVLNKINISFDLNSSAKKYETHLNGKNVEEDIRSVKVSEIVSIISRIPEVRKKMVDLQQKIGEKKGIVMDGRDIGTVVFPDAELKIFMTADEQIRAKRRYDELKAKGLGVDFSEILQNIRERDVLDVNRDISPLKKAEDAMVLDNSYMTPEQQLEWVSGIIEKL